MLVNYKALSQNDWCSIFHFSLLSFHSSFFSSLNLQLFPRCSPILSSFKVKAVACSNYNFSCCITGLPLTELLVASHIKPWAIDEKNRMNPRNGLCLNALHDKAFDKGLITIDENFKVVVSSLIQNASQPQLGLIQNIHGVPLKVPNRFRPDPELLDWHRTSIFRG